MRPPRFASAEFVGLFNRIAIYEILTGPFSLSGAAPMTFRSQSVRDHPAGAFARRAGPTHLDPVATTTVSGGGFFANRITVGDKPVMVTHVGRYHSPGNTGLHQVMILKRSLGVKDAPAVPSEMIATALVDASQSADADGLNYIRLERPIILLPGEIYYLASLENTNEQSPEPFPATGDCTVSTHALFGTGFTLDTEQNYHMTTAGTWEVLQYFAPLVNIKIN
jgi:hypothetical protein